MNRAQPHTIAGMLFPTRKALARYIRALMARYDNETPLSEPDVQFMVALLESQASTAPTIGSGVQRIALKPNPVFPAQRTFYVVRTDGSETHFSWVKCLSALRTVLGQEHLEPALVPCPQCGMVVLTRVWVMAQGQEAGSWHQLEASVSTVFGNVHTCHEVSDTGAS